MPALAEIQRDRWGRPLIPDPATGKPTPYTRVSTLAKALDDTTALTNWKLRQALQGIGLREDLLALARSARGDRQTLDRVAKEAMDAAASGAAANMGTALHAFCEQVDTGILGLDQIPAEQRPDVEAYLDALTRCGLKPVVTERFVVCDELKCAGTLDRVYQTSDGRFVVGDIKTGASAADYPGPITVQVATYAHGTMYDPATGRAPQPLPVDHQVGVLVHVPAGTGTATVYALDIAAGWEAAKQAAWVRDWRKAKPIRKW